MNQLNSSWRRAVIKIGSALIAPEGKKCSTKYLLSLVDFIHDCIHQGKEIVIVSSGSVAAGAGLCQQDLNKKLSIPQKQALAALGQTHIMHHWQKLFDDRCAQILLTRSDLDSDKRSLNIKNTLNTLIEINAIPIINENDSVAVDELVVGDNDNLAARVAVMCEADLLFICSDVDGLFDKNPKQFCDATLIKQVEKIDQQIFDSASTSDNSIATGGMLTKIQAAKVATNAGIEVVIVNGRKASSFENLKQGKYYGTRFIANVLTKQGDLIIEQCQKTKMAAKQVAISSSEAKNKTLLCMARILEENKELILMANKRDSENGKKAGLSNAMIDRLTITEETITQMQTALEQVVKLKDPLSIRATGETRPNGLNVSKKNIPLGVILMIYESRPNVTVEAASLAFKSGNAIILRGGKEAFESNQAIAKCWMQALTENAFDPAIINILETTDRRMLDKLLKLDEIIDVVIPRGGEGLIRHVVKHSFIPVIKHYKGVCNLYIDESADLDTALNILINGKTHRPGVCNALEGVVIHKNIADQLLPLMFKKLTAKDVLIFGCDKTQQILPMVENATTKEFAAEFLSLKISCKLVDNLNQAISFIDRYGSNHTEVIVTECQKNADKFVNEVDASVVMVNASSRFSDGGELGLGAEIGISTSKLHAYGPMGLESLTSEKFVVNGQGQIR